MKVMKWAGGLPNWSRSVEAVEASTHNSHNIEFRGQILFVPESLQPFETKSALRDTQLIITLNNGGKILLSDVDVFDQVALDKYMSDLSPDICRRKSQLVALAFESSADSISWLASRQEMRNLHFLLTHKDEICMRDAQRVQIRSTVDWDGWVAFLPTIAYFEWYSKKSATTSSITFVKSESDKDEKWIVDVLSSFDYLEVP
jgi:hypothetical protein